MDLGFIKTYIYKVLADKNKLNRFLIIIITIIITRISNFFLKNFFVVWVGGFL